MVALGNVCGRVGPRSNVRFGSKADKPSQAKIQICPLPPITDIDTPTAALSRPAVRVCLSLAIYPELKNKTLVGQVGATNTNSVLAVAKRPRTPPFVTAPNWKSLNFWSAICAGIRRCIASRIPLSCLGSRIQRAPSRRSPPQTFKRAVCV
jgi:hypothetical protein